MHGITARPWDMTVASAAPNVAMWKTMMNRRSNPIFVAAEHRRNIRGILLLPIALISDAQ